MTVTEAAPSYLWRKHAEMEVEKTGDGRTVFGIAVPFDRAAVVDDGRGPYTEMFKRGAFAKWMRNSGGRVQLMVNHDYYKRLPIGRATLLREDAAGLYGEFRISQTNEGDDVLTLARDGVLDAFSVGFVPGKDRRSAEGVVERTEVALREVSIVAIPSYADAVVTGIRSQFPSSEVSDEELARLAALLRSHPDLLDRLAEEASASEPSDTPDEGDDSAHDEGSSEPAEADRTATTVPVAVEPPHPTGTTSLDELRKHRELLGRRMQLVLRDQRRYL